MKHKYNELEADQVCLLNEVGSCLIWLCVVGLLFWYVWFVGCCFVAIAT